VTGRLAAKVVVVTGAALAIDGGATAQCDRLARHPAVWAPPCGGKLWCGSPAGGRRPCRHRTRTRRFDAHP